MIGRGQGQVRLYRHRVVAMSAADNRRCGEENLLFDREDLERSVELILGGDAHAADILARLFDGFRQAIDSGLRGINQTREALSEAVEITYLHSQSHAAAVELYRLSVEGQLKVEDEPVRLIGAAIGRSTARGQGSRASVRARGRAR